MTADCGQELKDSNVAFISLWPSHVKTEQVINILNEDPSDSLGNDIKERRMKGRGMIKRFSLFETTELSGKCIVALAKDNNIIKKTGKIHTTFDLCREYGLRDEEGFGPSDVQNVKHLLHWAGYTRLAAIVPTFLRIPKWILSLAGNKFG